jgi:hypothetical protein
MPIEEATQEYIFCAKPWKPPICGCKLNPHTLKSVENIFNLGARGILHGKNNHEWSRNLLQRLGKWKANSLLSRLAA